ncbi:MAG: hypothetical protein HQL69_02515 [Magnetococcales bacterium]|nr:hypothetical protein [Magnetococcales bacterium]
MVSILLQSLVFLGIVAMLLFDYILIFGITFILLVAVYIWSKRHELFTELHIFNDGKWNLPVELPETKLSDIEKKNPLLKEVIVVAHQVEEPQNGLLKAVKHNFSRGVAYHFIISGSSFATEREKYVRVFEGFANAASPDHVSHKQLVKVHQLNIEWTDVPYVFYRSKKYPESSEEFIFCYCGSQASEGISDRYILMGPTQSHTIFMMVKGLVNGEILPPVTEDYFNPSKTTGKVVAFNRKAS